MFLYEILSGDDGGSGYGDSSESKENSEPSKESNSQQETGKFYELLQNIGFSLIICLFKLMAVFIIYFVFRWYWYTMCWDEGIRMHKQGVEQKKASSSISKNGKGKGSMHQDVYMHGNYEGRLF